MTIWLHFLALNSSTGIFQSSLTHLLTQSLTFSQNQVKLTELMIAVHIKFQSSVTCISFRFAWYLKKNPVRSCWVGHRFKCKRFSRPFSKWEHGGGTVSCRPVQLSLNSKWHFVESHFSFIFQFPAWYWYDTCAKWDANCWAAPFFKSFYLSSSVTSEKIWKKLHFKVSYVLYVNFYYPVFYFHSCVFASVFVFFDSSMVP